MSSLARIVSRRLPKSIKDRMVWAKYIGSRLPDAHLYISHVIRKDGLEIGGPSALFRTILPIYSAASKIDGLNFSSKTIWEGNIQPGRTYNYFGKRKGTQYIADATNLSQIGDGRYDFVLSSNCLEHIANPIRALLEWKRVLKTNGFLILVVPSKLHNFDHRRPITTFDHILWDYENQTAEDDMSHLEEILALHDLSLDPPAGSLESFKARSLDNFQNRALHHHVFDLSLLRSMLNFIGMNTIQTSETKTDLFVLGKVM